MLSRILFLLLFLFSVNIQASEFPIEIIEYMDNTKVVAFINKSDIDKTSHWVPFKGSPPLTIDGALKSIKKFVASDPELNKAMLNEIELKQIPGNESYWHYLVKMKTRVDDKIHRHYFIVLMDGKIIQGIREPETLK